MQNNLMNFSDLEKEFAEMEKQEAEARAKKYSANELAQIELELKMTEKQDLADVKVVGDYDPDKVEELKNKTVGGRTIMMVTDVQDTEIAGLDTTKRSSIDDKIKAKINKLKKPAKTQEDDDLDGIFNQFK